MLVILKNTIFLDKKNQKLVKWSKIIAQQPETLENSNIIGFKSVTIDHPKTSHKLSKTIRHVE